MILVTLEYPSSRRRDDTRLHYTWGRDRISLEMIEGVDGDEYRCQSGSCSLSFS